MQACSADAAAKQEGGAIFEESDKPEVTLLKARLIHFTLTSSPKVFP